MDVDENKETVDRRNAGRMIMGDNRYGRTSCHRSRFYMQRTRYSTGRKQDVEGTAAAKHFVNPEAALSSGKVEAQIPIGFAV